MNTNEFNKIFADTLDRLVSKVSTKGKEYALDNDRLRNFTRAAEMLRCSKEQALWGFATKHLVSITEMVDESSIRGTPIDVWQEKIDDAIIYLILLYTIRMDRIYVVPDDIKAKPNKKKSRR